MLAADDPVLVTPGDADGAQPVPGDGLASTAWPDDGLLRTWPAVAVDVGKHHGYAFQWFSLSALLVGLTLWFQVVRPWRRSVSSNPAA